MIYAGIHIAGEKKKRLFGLLNVHPLRLFNCPPSALALSVSYLNCHTGFMRPARAARLIHQKRRISELIISAVSKRPFRRSSHAH